MTKQIDTTIETGAYVVHEDPPGVTHIRFFRFDDGREASQYIEDLTRAGHTPKVRTP